MRYVDIRKAAVERNQINQFLEIQSKFKICNLFCVREFYYHAQDTQWGKWTAHAFIENK